jgi:hypothetical protein
MQEWRTSFRSDQRSDFRPLAVSADGLIVGFRKMPMQPVDHSGCARFTPRRMLPPQ